MEHPEYCYGISRHNVIIPLKVASVVDTGDGVFEYTLTLNHPAPERYMVVQQEAQFNSRFVTAEEPLCGKHTQILATLDEAKERVKAAIRDERKTLLEKLEHLDRQLEEVDEQAVKLASILSE